MGFIEVTATSMFRFGLPSQRYLLAITCANCRYAFEFWPRIGLNGHVKYYLVKDVEATFTQLCRVVGDVHNINVQKIDIHKYRATLRQKNNCFILVKPLLSLRLM